MRQQCLVQLNGRGVLVVLVRHILRRQTLNVQAMRGLQQRRQLRVVHADLAAVDKLQQRLQIVRVDAGQHDHRVLAGRVLEQLQQIRTGGAQDDLVRWEAAPARGQGAVDEVPVAAQELHGGDQRRPIVPPGETVQGVHWERHLLDLV